VSLSNCDSGRRRAVGAALAGFAAVLPAAARAQMTFLPQIGASAPDVPLPYRTIAQNPAFRHAVAEILEWSCPYCRQINDGAIQWGRSLPKGWVFVQLPVLSTEKSMRAAALFAGMQQIAGRKLSAFDDALFSLVQDHAADPDDPRTLIQAAESAGLSVRDFRRDNTKADIMKTLREWLDLEKAARPQRTPTFVVAGRYVTDVSMTAGRYDLLFQLLSGLVSKSMGSN